MITQTRVIDTVPAHLRKQLKKEVLQEIKYGKPSTSKLELYIDHRASKNFKAIKSAVDTDKQKADFNRYFKHSYEDGKKALESKFDCIPFVIQYENKTIVFDARPYGDNYIHHGRGMHPYCDYEPQEGAPLPVQAFKQVRGLLTAFNSGLKAVTGEKLDEYKSSPKKFFAKYYPSYSNLIAVTINNKLFIFDLDA
jgi:hypothetical protein